MKKILVVLLLYYSTVLAQPHTIDRKSLVMRHTVVNTTFDTLATLTVGNGKFALSVDATGLQTFPELYRHGIPLGTQSEWGWHSFPNDSSYTLEETFRSYDFHDRLISFPVEWSKPERKKSAAQWFRQNPHRLHLGCIGFDLKKSDGSPYQPVDIHSLEQKLNLWTGTITSQFSLEGKNVTVTTACHPDQDAISVRVVSDLLSSGQISIRLRFPYPTGLHTDDACDWNQPSKHKSEIMQREYHKAVIQRTIDAANYYTVLGWSGTCALIQTGLQTFNIRSMNSDTMDFTCLFTKIDSAVSVPSFGTTRTLSEESWIRFWNSGGAVDFSGSTDARAFELERRMILSQYLLRVQCSGFFPPQETGLTCNSWFGKFHLEMQWWHTLHNALWGRTEILEKNLEWYKQILPQAAHTAKEQGFKGVRWPKMTDPSGCESPSKVGPFILWQQPHPIYYAEMIYRQHPTIETVKKYEELVLSTAEFMASFAFYDSLKHKYILGPALIPAQELFDPASTVNPPFELAYWHWGISTAQQWLERLNRPRNILWDSILNNLSHLSTSDGLYLAAESAPDSYTNTSYLNDHPIVLGAFGFLPISKLIDTSIMHSTFDFILAHWNWKSTWGWDYPLMAMTAVRLGQSEKAIDILMMNCQKNTYLKNGHNYQDERLRIYLPGNGGLLSAIAMLCAGYDGCTSMNPGIPKNGLWKVQWENLKRME